MVISLSAMSSSISIDLVSTRSSEPSPVASVAATAEAGNSSRTSATGSYCRDRSGLWAAEPDFRYRTCASCYGYLFAGGGGGLSSATVDGPYLVFTAGHTTVAAAGSSPSNDSSTSPEVRRQREVAILADIRNDERRTEICATLSNYVDV